MRKLILSVAALATMAVGQAQEKVKTDKVAFGVKAGLNVSSTSTPVESSFSSLTGMHIGAFVAVPLTSKFTFQPELLYSMQGFKEHNTKSSGSAIYDSELKLNYVSVPLVFQYQFEQKFYAELGPQIDVLMSAKNTLTSTYLYTNTTTTRESDVKNYSKSLVFGVDFGAGYHITKSISANVRYHLGLTSANKTEKFNNRVLQLGVGYKF